MLKELKIGGERFLSASYLHRWLQLALNGLHSVIISGKLLYIISSLADFDDGNDIDDDDLKNNRYDFKTNTGKLVCIVTGPLEELIVALEPKKVRLSSKIHH